MSAGVSELSIAAETPSSPRKPRNQGVAARAPENVRAPNGAVTAQSPTALDAANPPRLHWRRNGNTSMKQSWVRRKAAFRPLLARNRNPPRVRSW